MPVVLFKGKRHILPHTLEKYGTKDPARRGTKNTQNAKATQKGGEGKKKILPILDKGAKGFGDSSAHRCPPSMNQLTKEQRTLPWRRSGGKNRDIQGIEQSGPGNNTKVGTKSGPGALLKNQS